MQPEYIKPIYNYELFCKIQFQRVFASPYTFVWQIHFDMSVGVSCRVLDCLLLVAVLVDGLRFRLTYVIRV